MAMLMNDPGYSIVLKNTCARPYGRRAPRLRIGPGSAPCRRRSPRASRRRRGDSRRFRPSSRACCASVRRTSRTGLARPRGASSFMNPHHEHVAGFSVLHDSGDQAIQFGKIHGHNKNPAGWAGSQKVDVEPTTSREAPPLGHRGPDVAEMMRRKPSDPKHISLYRARGLGGRVAHVSDAEGLAGPGSTDRLRRPRRPCTRTRGPWL